jgi:hypothetical protein
MRSRNIQIEAIIKWQQLNYFPLKCKINEAHRLLIPIEENKKVILKCQDCEYTQEYIPEIVLNCNKSNNKIRFDMDYNIKIQKK